MTEPRKEKPRVHVRWMIRRDMPEVLAIESKSFEFPWNEEDFLHNLRQRNCIGMVADVDDKVAGYMVYELGKHRLRLDNIAVDPEMRREEIGTQLVEKLAGKLSRQRRNHLQLAVREGNLPAQQFFRECGFWAVNTLPKYYKDADEDAYDMRLKFTTMEQKVVRAIEELERVTGIQWELAQKDDNGMFHRRDLEKIDEDNGVLALRPRLTLKNPRAACAALNRLGGCRAEVGWNHDNPDELMVPVRSIPELQRRYGKDRELAKDFEASAEQVGHASRVLSKRHKLLGGDQRGA